MAYTITTTAGSTLATVADGTVNTTTTSLTLIGKNYAGYGIFLNENYVKLLENFASGTAPTGALTGQIWYDTSAQTLKVYKGSSSWKPISSTATSPTPPTGAVTGDLWWDTSTNRLNVYSGSGWVVIGPSFTSTSGTSGAIVETIIDTSSVSHIAVKMYVSNTVVGIFSKDATYTPQTSIAGFTSIRPGFNLVSSSTIIGAQFTGDVSNALTLQGVAASQFLRSDQNTSTLFQVAANALRAGSDLDITSVTEASIYASTANKDLLLRVNRGGSPAGITVTGSTGRVTLSHDLTVGGATTLNGALTVAGTVLPTANATVNVGSTSFRFATMFASTFNGRATEATYADLAERFEADQTYTPGTVVELGGIKEITAAIQELSENVFGVISTLPGFLMNSGAGTNKTHPPVAVNGRVPVRVIGKVKKGDRLVSAGSGLARSATRSEITAFNVLGRALEDKTTDDEGLIEAIVKLNS